MKSPQFGLLKPGIGNRLSLLAALELPSGGVPKFNPVADAEVGQGVLEPSLQIFAGSKSDAQAGSSTICILNTDRVLRFHVNPAFSLRPMA